MSRNTPDFQFIEPSREYQSIVRRIILGHANGEIQLNLPIRPTGFAYFTYSRYPEDLTLHYSNKKVKSKGKLGFANQILGENPFFEIKGKFYQIGIELFPHIPYALFGLHGNKLLNQIYIFPPDNPEISHVIRELDTLDKPQDVAMAMQKYLWKKSNEIEIRTDVVNILKEIYKSNGQIQISTLAKNHGISNRHMQRLFNDYIGLGPKQYAMVIQFNHVQQKLLNGNNTSFGSYHDQAHFTKMCKRITGYTPRELMELENSFLSAYLK